MSVALVVVAAGVGRRLGDAVAGPKALTRVGGRTLLAHSLDRLVGPDVAELVVVHTPGHRAAFESATDVGEVRWIEGGESRSASVRRGVAATARTCGIVAIHDAARAFAPRELLTAGIGAVAAGALAAAPALPIADTLKRVDDREVLATVDRSGLAGIQTPQVFRREALETVLAWAGETEATDELGLVEAAREDGVVEGRIVAVPGSRWGLKVTWPEDLEIAELLAGGR